MTMNDERAARQQEEAEFCRILSLASEPQVPAGASERLLARLAAQPPANVVSFRPREATRPARSWRLFPAIAALPLAASLALGIYLGAMGSLDSFLPSSITGDVAENIDLGDGLNGLSDAETYVEDNVS